jgi:Ca2+-transporting ATPase
MATEASHLHDVEDVVAALATDRERGLTQAEARLRLGKYGPNLIKERGQPGPLAVFADQLRDTTILVLLGAAVVSGFIGDLKDAITISVIVVLNAAIAFVQDLRARRAISALKKLGAAKAIVIRGGERQIVDAATLVPGDLVLLEAGGIVPADLRLLAAAQLRVSEAMLTGESVAVEKQTNALAGDVLPLGDRTNMVFKGTTVASGRGAGVVAATGMQTELGRLARMMEESARRPRRSSSGSMPSDGGSASWWPVCALSFSRRDWRAESR